MHTTYPPMDMMNEYKFLPHRHMKMKLVAVQMIIAVVSFVWRLSLFTEPTQIGEYEMLV